MAKLNPEIKIKIQSGYLKNKVIQGKVKQIFNEELQSLADELTEQSYVGATKAKNKGISLKEGWHYKFSDRSLSKYILRAKITNDSPAYIHRVAGRSSGKFPPLEPLIDWVQVKIGIRDIKKARGVAYVIGRKIAREGTERYKSGRNFAGLNVDGTIQKDSIINKYRSNIIKRISKL